MAGLELKLNPALARVKESATLAINQQTLELRRQGRELAHFGFGQSPFPVHPKIAAALVANSQRKEYLPTLGLPELRDNIAAYYDRRGYKWDAANIVIGPGSKELLFDLIYLLAGTLLLPVPSWVSYYPQAQLAGKRVKPVMTEHTNSYKITPAGLEAAIAQARVGTAKQSPEPGAQAKPDDDSAKLNTGGVGEQQAAASGPGEQLILLLNSPNNPAGNVYTERELQELSQIIRRQEIIVIADEIYAEVCFDSAAPTKIAPSIAKYAPEHTLVTSGMSKSFSAGGYRLGFLAMPQNLAAQLLPALKAMISETYSCVAAPIQAAAVVAYSDDEEINQYVRDCTEIHALMARFIQQQLAQHSINCPVGGGAFYLFPDFNAHRAALQKRGITNSQELCAALLTEAGVVLLPAVDFGLPADYYGCRLATVDYDGAALIQAKQGGATDEELLALAPNITKGCAALGAWLRECSII